MNEQIKQPTDNEEEENIILSIEKLSKVRNDLLDAITEGGSK